MADKMDFPDTVEEFMEQYKVVDTDGVYMSKGSELVPIFRMMQWFEQLPSAQPEVIRCKDCRWWDKYGDYDNGYCMAAKHGYFSEHWEISIRRTYKGDFYCADAEVRGEQDERH